MSCISLFPFPPASFILQQFILFSFLLKKSSQKRRAFPRKTDSTNIIQADWATVQLTGNQPANPPPPPPSPQRPPPLTAAATAIIIIVVAAAKTAAATATKAVAVLQ